MDFLKKKFFVKGVYFGLVFSSLFFLFFSVKVQAQEEDSIKDLPRGIQVSPFRLDWNLNSGEERTGVINLKNYSEENYEAEIQIENFFVTDDSSQAKFFVPQENDPIFAYDVNNWIEIPEKIILNPKEGKDIVFKIKVPEDMPTGGYYGAIFIKTNSSNNDNEKKEGAQVMVNQRIGILLVMAVKGDEAIRMKGDINQFKPKNKIFWQNPANLIANISNSGNLHFKLFGKIDIFRFGKKIDSLDINPKFNYPGKIRIYDEKWNFSYWAHGFYKARIYLVSEDESVKMAAETNFWIIPWRETSFVIFLIIFLWIIYRWFGKNFEIKKKEKNISFEE